MDCGQHTDPIQLSILPPPVEAEVADTPHLADYDVILLNTSAGKDSQAMMDLVVAQARAEGVVGRLIAVHCDLGDVEWPGTRHLAAEQVGTVAATSLRGQLTRRRPTTARCPSIWHRP